MGRTASHNAFRKGLEAAARGDYLEGLAYFEASVHLARRHGDPAVQMKSFSYYGWCLAMSSNRLDEALSVCEAAARAEFYDPELRLNLGRVYLRAGDRGLAFGSFVSGLRLSPDHQALRREISRLGVRRRPVLQFLSRSHPVNRLLGLWRGGRQVAGSPSRGVRPRVTGR